jgi:predicted aldo/keto reductase-like oxidoreductase
MKVPQKLVEIIRQLQSHGDIAEIQARYGFSRYRISEVMEGDPSSDPDVIAAVAEFYTERKDILSDFITD